MTPGMFPDLSNVSEYEVIQQVSESFRGQRYLNASDICLISLYALIALASLVGNGLFLFLSFRYRGLRRHISYIMMSVAGSNLLVTCICIPASAYRLFYLNWSMGEIGCKLVMYVEALALTVNSISLAAVAIFRARQSALMITPNQASNRGLRLVVTATWLSAFLVSIPALFAVSLEQIDMADLLNLTALPELDGLGNDGNWSFLDRSSSRPVLYLCSEHRHDLAGRTSQKAYSAYFLLLLFLSPCVVLTFSYGFTARFISRQFARLAKGGAAASDAADGPASISLRRRRAGNYKGQMAAAYHARELQKHTVKTVVLLVAFFFFSWCPKDLIIVLQDFVLHDQQQQQAATILMALYPYTQALIYLHSALCPLLYWCLSRVFRRYVCRVFSCRKF